MDFAVSAHKTDLKEIETIDKYLDLEKVVKLKVTVMPVIFRALKE